MPDQELIARPQTELEATAAKKLIDLLKKYERSFAGVLPKELTLQRWQWLIVNSIRKTPALCGVTPTSFLNSVLLAANLQVEIRDRSAYLIPFGRECQLLLDYRAKIDLANRAGWTVKAELVRERDSFDHWYDDGGLHFLHKPNLIMMIEGRLQPVTDRGEVVLGYAYCVSGDKRIVDIMTVDEIERIRRRSRNPGRSKRDRDSAILTLEEIRAIDPATLSYSDHRRVPWVTDWDRMATKTVIHRAFNSLPCTPEMAESQEIDDAVEAPEKKMPVAPQMAEMLYQIDPADDQPLLPEGSREAQTEVHDRIESEAIEGLGLTRMSGESADQFEGRKRERLRDKL